MILSLQEARLHIPSGRRVRKTVVGIEGSDSWTISDTAFAYWDWHLIAELNVSWNGTASRKRHYVWGLDKEGVRPGAGGVGGLLMVADNVTNKTYLAMNDYIGNVVGLIDSSDGSVAAAYEYDPFGRPIRETGTYAAQNPIRFSSQYTDHETGLVYFGFRYYHPQWGRFLNRDPIEELGGGNLYRFVSNDPVNRWDLLGLSFSEVMTNASFFSTGWVATNEEMATVGQVVAASGSGGTDLLQAGIGTAGLIPGVGNLADLTNATISTARGNYADAAIDGAAAIPAVGQAVGGAKVLDRAAGGVEKIADAFKKLGSEPKGGTYKLTDPETGGVRRTGRTNDLERREKEHARGEDTKDLKFEVDRRSDNSDARRGREQIIHDEHPEADLNKANPISPDNPKKEQYMEAGSEL